MHVHDIFRHLFPRWSVFPALRPSTIRVSSLKLEELNDSKYSRVADVAQSRGKERVICQSLSAEVGGFPPSLDVGAHRGKSALTCVSWCQKSAFKLSHSQLKSDIISLVISSFINPCHYSKLIIQTFFFFFKLLIF